MGGCRFWRNFMTEGQISFSLSRSWVLSLLMAFVLFLSQPCWSDTLAGPFVLPVKNSFPSSDVINSLMAGDINKDEKTDLVVLSFLPGYVPGFIHVLLGGDPGT